MLDIPIEELRVLNPQYRKDIIPGDVKPYALRLPSQLIYNYLMFSDSIRSASAALAPRSTVNIGGTAAGGDGNGTWKEVTKWHKVRRGETISAIASRYGVTISQIKRWNKLKSNRLRRGARLKIQTREFIPAPVVKSAETSPAIADTVPDQPVDTLAIAPVAICDSIPTTTTAVAIEEQPEPKAAAEVNQTADVETTAESAPAKTSKSQAMRTHKVAKGDTLYAISKRYGVSVQKIQQANNLTGSKLTVGQRLKIPSK